MNKEFDIVSQIQSELEDFNNSTVNIANPSSDGSVSTLSQKGGYQFSQKDTINTIDLYYNSKFESGAIDSEGQKKYFLNICRFRQEVAEKQTDIDVKDFLFVPELDTAEYPAFFMTKAFRQWAKKNKYGKIINALNHDYSKYGSCVAKLVGDEIERVPLNTLRNQQNAECLEDASYVILEHKGMSMSEVKKHKGWDLSGLDLNWNDTVDIFERYGEVPLSYYKKQTGGDYVEGDEKETVYCMCIVSLKAKKNSKEYEGNLLFIEETECPLREAHWTRVDGRWLGVGEIEKNFDNQIFRNMVVNMRRRGLLWSSKKIFQSTDTDISQNLIRNVKDGEVLKIMPNGQITQVNMETRGLAEFEAASREIDLNADKTSFTFESASGESMPSGTPFRLGVMLSQAVASYFNLKKENFGLFMEDIVYDLLLPLFKKQNKKSHMLQFSATEEGVEKLKKDLIDLWVYNDFKKRILNGEYADLALIRASVEKQINERSNHWLEIPDGFYDDIKANVDLVITGESMNIEKRLETLTNVYTQLVQQGDPNAKKIMAKILSLTGESLDSLVGMQSSNMNQQNPQALMQTLQGQGQVQAPAPMMA